jgi:hypothetical protein
LEERKRERLHTSIISQYPWVVCSAKMIRSLVFKAHAFETVADLVRACWRDRKQLSQSESATGKGNKHSFGE